MAKIVETGIDPHLFSYKRQILIVNCSNESIDRGQTRVYEKATPAPSTPPLLHVRRNSSSVSHIALNGWRLMPVSLTVFSF
uniref:Uncharacterized protein n=1 Tax=Angiostrongylus cantonensis TaxID=6313 RepID=A0A0K0CYC3_ANGCA